MKFVDLVQFALAWTPIMRTVNVHDHVNLPLFYEFLGSFLPLKIYDSASADAS